jgi:hypothetical protein
MQTSEWDNSHRGCFLVVRVVQNLIAAPNRGVSSEHYLHHSMARSMPRDITLKVRELQFGLEKLEGAVAHDPHPDFAMLAGSAHRHGRSFRCRPILGGVSGCNAVSLAPFGNFSRHLLKDRSQRERRKYE